MLAPPRVRPASDRCGKAAWLTHRVLSRFNRITSPQNASSVSASGFLARSEPALLTRMSSPPRNATASSTVR